MDTIAKYLIVFTTFIILHTVSSHTYSVKVGTEKHVNVVDRRFLSFTVDPKYLFASTDGSISQESVSMAASLTPAFLRIAGPSTSHMTFHNSTITFTDLTADLELDSEEEDDHKTKEFGLKKILLPLQSDEESAEEFSLKKRGESGFKKRLAGLHSDEEFGLRKTLKNKRHSGLSKVSLKKGRGHFGLKKEKERVVEEPKELAVSYSQLQKFVQWANSSGFNLVFALNNEEKMSSGLWDPNSVLNMLTMAEKANFSEIYWQLGYECSNQSIDEYLNDLETLRAIVESFDAQEWRAVGGDVTRCLSADSKSDFIDYVTLTEDMMDAVFLNGNSSAQELQRMSEHDRLKLLKLLSNSTTPLWLTESSSTSPRSELHRAADWMTGLGYSARNGFAHHFRDLTHHELFNPTLSFYMALLFKNLVGERVLDVEMESSEAVLFAHCTSLRHKPVPGAVTLYGANLDDETARFAVKLSRREEGGDIMQFILGHDLNGNIIINGRAMYEPDIRPVVKRVRPYKTLLLNLPPRSFGFWVIANTKIEACQEIDEQDITEKKFVEASPIDDEAFEGDNTVKTKRSMILAENTSSEEQLEEVLRANLVKEGLKERINELNSHLNNVHKIFENKEEVVLSRQKRQIEDEDEFDVGKRKLKKFLRNKMKTVHEPKPRFDFIRKLIGLSPKSDSPRTFRHDKVKRLAKIGKGKVQKRNSKAKTEIVEENLLEDEIVNSDAKVRKRRSVISEKKNLSAYNDDISEENEVDIDTSKEMKLWKILHKIHKQLKDLPTEEGNSIHDSINTESKDEKDEDHIVVKTKLSDDGPSIHYKDKSKRGLLKTTVDNVVSVLSDLNNNLNRFWDALTFLE